MASLYSWLRLMVAADLGVLPRPSAAPPLRLALAAVLQLVLAFALLVFPSELEEPASSPPSAPAPAPRRSHGRIARSAARSSRPVSSNLKRQAWKQSIYAGWGAGVRRKPTAGTTALLGLLTRPTTRRAAPSCGSRAASVVYQASSPHRTRSAPRGTGGRARAA